MNKQLEKILQQEKSSLRILSNLIFYIIPIQMRQLNQNAQIPVGYPWPQQPPIVIGPKWPNTEPQPKLFPGIYDFPEWPIKPIIRDPVEKYKRFILAN